MASFEEIMKRPGSEIKPPPAYPVGTYHCLIDGPLTPGKSSQKQTDFLQVKFKILSPMQDVDARQAAEVQVVGKTVTAEYYITDNASWRLTEMLRDHLDISDSDPLEQMVAQAPGKQILVKLRHELSQDGKRVFHRVDSTAHV
jgi:hypothetical protein